MSNKKFLYLIVITVVLCFLAVLSYLIQPRYETSIEKGGAIFDKIENQINDIKEIRIDDSRKKISITKDNDNWFMASKFGYKVKNEIVRKNLIQISELRFFEKKTKEESLYGRLNLDYPDDEDGESKFISLTNNNNDVVIEFILGKRKKDGVYIKKVNDKQTWLTSGSLDMSSTTNDWLETRILDIKYEDVKTVSITQFNLKDSFSLSKDKQNDNLVINDLNKDQIPKSDLIANFLGYFLTNLIFEDVTSRKEFSDDMLQTKIQFELTNNINITANIFKEDKKKWINFDIDNDLTAKLTDKSLIFVSNINEWSYKLPPTKYDVSDTKLKDLLVED